MDTLSKLSELLSTDFGSLMFVTVVSAGIIETLKSKLKGNKAQVLWWQYALIGLGVVTLMTIATGLLGIQEWSIKMAGTGLSAYGIQFAFSVQIVGMIRKEQQCVDKD